MALNDCDITVIFPEIDNVAEETETITDIVAEDWENITDNVAEERENITDNVREERENITDNVAEERENITDNVVEERENITDNVGEERNNITDNVVEERENITDNVGEERNNITDNVAEERENITDNVAEERENITDNDQANPGEDYMLAPSTGSQQLVHSNHVLVNQLMKQTRKTHENTPNECNGKNISIKKNRQPNSVHKKTVAMSQASSKMRISAVENFRSKVSQKSNRKGDPTKSSGTESKRFVSALKSVKCPKKSCMKTKSHSDMCARPETTVTVGTPTPTLLSMIAQAVGTPQYTSVYTAEYPTCARRNSWPLLREMIGKPAVSSVSISPVPRQSLSTVHLEPANEEPKARVVSKLQKEIKCECKFNKGQPCWFLFEEASLRKERLHHLTLKRESLDLVILAKIAANINREEKTKKCHGQDRQRCRVSYYHEGRQICRETFMFIHGICKGRLCALMQHYKKKGLSIRIHGNKANIPHHALSDEDSDRVLDFIRKYANSHCLSTFGRRPRSPAGGGLLIMSPTQSKLYVHHKYKLWCYENKHRVVSLRSFQNLWTKHLPYIVVLRGSNKTPVPEQKSHKNVFGLEEDETLPEVTAENTFQLHFNSSIMKTDRKLKEVNIHANNDCKQSDSSTLPDFDCVTNAKVNRKRKSLPPRKVELSYCLSESTERDFEHNKMFSEPHIMHPFMSNNQKHIKLSNTDSLAGSEAGSGSDVHLLQAPLQQIDLDHPLLMGEQHISQTTGLPPLDSHRKVLIDLPDQQSAVILPTSKDIVYNFNKPGIPTRNPTRLHAPLCLTQSSQLLDAYSMQCCERPASEVSNSHCLYDQTQSVFQSHQSPNLSNMHQLEWQTWQTYSTL